MALFLCRSLAGSAVEGALETIESFFLRPSDNGIRNLPVMDLGTKLGEWQRLLGRAFVHEMVIIGRVRNIDQGEVQNRKRLPSGFPINGQ